MPPTPDWSLDRLLDITPPTPAPDFESFWCERFERCHTRPARPRLAASPLRLPGWKVSELEFNSTDGITLSGWLLEPQAGPVRRGLVLTHGYGGRDGPGDPIPLSECAVILPCLRGLGRSTVPGISTNPFYHVRHDIQDRDRYLLGGCVEDVWMATTALAELHPQVADHLAYMGTSFGGGIGALATPWDKRFQRVHLALPTFGHQPLRLTIPCAGSGESLRLFQERAHFNILETLAYYDAAVAASFLRVPVHLACALHDPCVPPPGQFAIHNAISAPLRRLFILPEGHTDYREKAAQEERLQADLREFFQDL